jgi:sugar phosphate isomerase/epimerase
MFKLGFCYPIEWSPADLKDNLIRLKALGYEGVELWHKDLIASDLAILSGLFEEIGIACAQICPYFDFVHGSLAWEESLRLADEYIAWARQLGKPLIRVFTGPGVGAASATEEHWQAAISGLQQICDLAAPHGIQLALECHAGSLMEDSPSTLRLLQGVKRNNLGVNLQLPLMNGNEPIEVSLESLGQYTCHTHAHNYTSLNGGHFRPLGQGVLDYHDIISRLTTKGFNGYVSIEHASYEGTCDPWETARIEAEYLTGLRRRLLCECEGR